jgi:hypothetical protein
MRQGIRRAGVSMNKLKLKRKTALIFNWIFTIAYLFFATWVDWRIAVMIILFDISRAFEDIGGGK